ncbi:hypothetical protein F5880DRAFT_1656188 [Lentinula raphanica]|nr:hypothetical protein F5880DRAFT_1656188 [Lentinula raphanica]
MVDDGAMVAAMDSGVYHRLREEIGGWSSSVRRFRMADGSVVLGVASWEGRISVGGVAVDGIFEVFDSGGSWQFLFRKPLLESFRAVHDYRNDTLRVENERKQKRLIFNQGLGSKVLEVKPMQAKMSTSCPIRLVEEDQCIVASEAEIGGVSKGCEAPLCRRVPTDSVLQVLPDSADHTSQKLQATREPRVSVESVVEPELVGPEELERQFREARRQQDLWVKEWLRRAKDEERREEHMRERKWKVWWTANFSKGARLLRFRRRNRVTRTPHKVVAAWGSEKRKRRRRNKRKKRVSLVGGSHAPPSRAVLSDSVSGIFRTNPRSVDQTEQMAPVCVVTDEEIELPGIGSDLLPDGLDTEAKGVFTRNEGPDGAFRPARVEEILKQVTIGSGLSREQLEKVKALLASYADCFALSIGEVRPVPGAVHKLNVPGDAKFSTKVRQKGLTPPQREYLHKKKAHEGQGLTIEELKAKLDLECVQAGVSFGSGRVFSEPARPGTRPAPVPDMPGAGYPTLAGVGSNVFGLRAG